MIFGNDLSEQTVIGHLTQPSSCGGRSLKSLCTQILKHGLARDLYEGFHLDAKRTLADGGCGDGGSREFVVGGGMAIGGYWGMRRNPMAVAEFQS